MKLLLTGAIGYSEEQLYRIKSVGFDILYIDDERTPLQIDVAQIEAVVCNNLFLYHDITDFKNLKLIQLTSAGLDRIPLEYINGKGIRLYNAGDVYSIPMAEWTVLKILEIYKKSRHFYRMQDKHRWEKNQDLLELTGKRATIIGLGHVGTAIACRLKSFGVRIMGVDTREVESEFIECLYIFEELDEILKASDIIILALPLTAETYNLINADRLNLMPDQSILVNLSRGGLIVETDLIKALQNGKFLGVALDVFEKEPLPKDSLLWDFNRIIITPHNSYASDQVHQRLTELICQNLIQFIKNAQREGSIFNE